MTELVYATKSIQDLLSKIEHEVLIVQELIKDQSFSLEDRWNLYFLAEDILPQRSWCADSLDILTDSPYDDLNMERYSTHTNSSIDESILENYDPEQPEPSDTWGVKYYERAKRMFEKRDEWREAVLAEGYGSFTYDW